MVPFSFGADAANEGSFAQITCVVSEGDEPLTISWSFHGHNLTTDFGIMTQNMGTRVSSLMISSVGHKHMGQYTCTASNSAGKASYSANLRVNGRLLVLFEGEEEVL